MKNNLLTNRTHTILCGQKGTAQRAILIHNFKQHLYFIFAIKWREKTKKLNVKTVGDISFQNRKSYILPKINLTFSR